MTSRPRLIAALAVIVALSACNLSTDLDPDRVDVGIALVPIEDQGGVFRALPTVQFAENALISIEQSTARGDACVGPLAINPGGGGGAVEFIDAGPQLGWQTATSTTNLVKLVNGTVITYAAASAQGIAATPGEPVTITVPGADPGFPAMTVNARLAEQVTGIGPVNPVPGAGQGLALQWTAATVATDSVKMEVRIQYALSGSTPTEEVLCRVDDDGSHTVPDGQLFGWRNASDASRRVIFSRFRSVIIVQTEAQFGFLSSFSVTKSTFP
jgi:hypothetical protein